MFSYSQQRTWFCKSAPNIKKHKVKDKGHQLKGSVSMCTKSTLGASYCNSMYLTHTADDTGCTTGTIWRLPQQVNQLLGNCWILQQKMHVFAHNTVSNTIMKSLPSFTVMYQVINGYGFNYSLYWVTGLSDQIINNNWIKGLLYFVNTCNPVTTHTKYLAFYDTTILYQNTLYSRSW